MIIPAIDILGGEVVRLKQGDFNKKTSFGNDPIAAVHRYARAGAESIHIVDLEGARDPDNRQTELLSTIVKEIGCRIQIGGGIRSLEDVETLLSAGASRVVVGSLAIKSPATIASWANNVGLDQILPAVDVKADEDGVFRPVVNGWTAFSRVDLDELLSKLADTGFREILMTDVSLDGMMSGPNHQLYSRLRKKHPQLCFQASGGVANIADIQRLKQPSISGIILGRVLLEGAITIEEALACWQNA